jgi:hypothetical protein
MAMAIHPTLSALMRRRSTGTNCSSNHGLRLNHAVLRGEGCGSG